MVLWFFYAGAVWYNLAERKTLLAKLQEQDEEIRALNANLISKGIRSISAAPDKTGQDSYLFSASNDFPLKDITAPRYTKGILVIASRDAIMIGVDLIGHKLIIGTRVNNVWTSGRIL